MNTRKHRKPRKRCTPRTRRGGSLPQGDVCMYLEGIKKNLKSKNWDALKMLKNRNDLQYQLSYRSRRGSLVKSSEITKLKKWAQSQIDACSLIQDKTKKIRVKQSGNQMVLYGDGQSSYWNCECTDVSNASNEKDCNCMLMKMQSATAVRQ